MTGPVFWGADRQAVRGRRVVPTSVFKAVHNPKRGTKEAYLVPNTDDAGWKTVLVARLRDRDRPGLFPLLTESDEGRHTPASQTAPPRAAPLPYLPPADRS